MLILRQPWTRQPTGLTRINTAHWLAKDLIFAHSGVRAFVFGQPAPDVPPALRGAVAGDSNPALFTSRGWVPDGTNSELYQLKINLALPLTLSAWWYGTAGTTLDAILSVRRDTTFAGDGGISLARQTTEVVIANSRTTAAGSSTATASGGYASGRWQHGVGVFASITSRAAYADGGNVGTNVISRVFPADCSVIAVGNFIFPSDFPTTTVIGGIALPLVIARALSADEVTRLYNEQRANPWGLFAERRILVPVPAASGYTHPTLSNARMGSLTPTGGVPMVDYAF